MQKSLGEDPEMIKGLEKRHFKDRLQALFSPEEGRLGSDLTTIFEYTKGRSRLPFAQTKKKDTQIVEDPRQTDTREDFPSFSWLRIMRRFKFLNLSREKNLRIFRHHPHVNVAEGQRDDFFFFPNLRWSSVSEPCQQIQSTQHRIDAKF